MDEPTTTGDDPEGTLNRGIITNPNAVITIYLRSVAKTSLLQRIRQLTLKALLSRGLAIGRIYAQTAVHHVAADFKLVGRWLWRLRLALFAVLVLMFAVIAIMNKLNWLAPAIWVVDVEATDANALRETISNIVRNAVLTAIALAGGVFALWRLVLLNKQTESQYRSQLHDRFTKAIEQMGSENMAVRLGGIFALEQLAREQPDLYHNPTMDTLTAFARHHHEDGLAKTHDHSLQAIEQARREGRSESSSRLDCRADVQAIFDVIGRRGPEQMQMEERKPNLSRLQLRYQRIRLKGNFRGVDFGYSDFLRSEFWDPNFKDANLQYVDFRGADVFRADFSSAYCFCTNFHFSGISADFSETDLRHANFQNASLSSHKLREANIAGANFDDALICSVDFSGAFLLEPNQLTKSAWRNGFPPKLPDGIQCVNELSEEHWSAWYDRFHDTRSRLFPDEFKVPAPHIVGAS